MAFCFGYCHITLTPRAMGCYETYASRIGAGARWRDPAPPAQLHKLLVRQTHILLSNDSSTGFGVQIIVDL